MKIFAEEKRLFKQGLNFVAGVDEAGRGPLAGPVVAACVAINKDFEFKQEYEVIKDSKKISEKKRELIYDLIISEFIHVGIGVASSEEIDKINILQATFLAMQRAVQGIQSNLDFVMIDGKFIVPDLDIEQKSIVKGDEKIFLIGAASIIAKVTRDRIMQKIHLKYPEYEFIKHKGYGTKKHLEKIEKFGACPIHRKSFAPFKYL
jgi:ribonuclease HII